MKSRRPGTEQHADRTCGGLWICARPCGDGTGVLVYHYNSYVYPSDEARMLYDMGDNKFCLGSVEAPMWS